MSDISDKRNANSPLRASIPSAQEAYRTRMLALADKLDEMAYADFLKSRKYPNIFPQYRTHLGRKSGLQDAAEMIRDEVGEDALPSLCDCSQGDCHKRTRRCRKEDCWP